MANLTVRDVDDEIVEWFRGQAKAHQRSLEGEIRALLEREARQRRKASWLKRVDRLRKQVPPWKPGMPTAVEFVREARDEDRH
jgi:plasmid stability protein